MIDIYGVTEYDNLVDALYESKRQLADQINELMEVFELTIEDLSHGLWMSTYQISYYIRNPKHSKITSLLKILTRVRQMVDDEFEKRTIKYILHPTWIRPKNAESFYVNAATVASLYSVDLGECIQVDFATPQQLEECIHLEVVANDT